MKTLLITSLFILFSSGAEASPKLFKNIADSIDSLLSDTVNEGDMTAYVEIRNGKPTMSCQLSSYREPGKGVAKCDVTFDIESNYTDETQTCQQTCFLVHVYDLKSFEITSRVEKLIDSCMENLSSGCD